MHVYPRQVRGHQVWYASCVFLHPKTGKRKRVRKSTGIRVDGTAAARKRAELVGAEFERRLAAGLDRGSRQTLAKAFRAREKALVVRRAPRSTIARAEFSAARVFDLIGPDTDCLDVDERMLMEYAAKRLSLVSPDTVRRELSDLQASYTALGLECPRLPALPSPRVVERWLTREEILRLLAQAPPKRARVIALVWQTGLRKGEVFHLKRLGHGVGRLVGEEGLKTGARTVPLTPMADAILQEGPLEPWSNQGRDLKAFAARAGLGRVTWNDIRASTSTQLLLADVSPTKIAALLGHTSTRMVERRYARLKNVNVLPSDLIPLGETDVRQISGQTTPPETVQAASEAKETPPEPTA